MEMQIKKAVKAGNSSAVIVPRSWLDKEVRIELIRKDNETILSDVISIVKKYIDTEKIIGVYLTGSYARGEEDKDSDIDVLVVTDGIDKEMINDGIYNILLISSKLINWKLENDLFPIGQMIKEAKPLINSSYLAYFEVRATKKNLNWYIKTTDEKIKLIGKVLENVRKGNEKYINNSVIYTLILRIRTLYIIECLVSKKDYLKKEFLKLIRRISNGDSSYKGYLSVKDNLNEEDIVGIDDAEKLHDYLKDYYIRVKEMVGGLKVE